jgi:branched-chain amino acid transport system ATP-binding protein
VTLRVCDLQAGYGAIQVLFGVTLEVRAGQIVTLLGRNGMGKSTTIRSIMGMTSGIKGQIDLGGDPIVGRAPDEIARRGIGLVPEGRHVFPTLTVRENLLATARAGSRHKNPCTLARVYQLFPRLAQREHQFANTLSGGEQQMLAIGRALMINPSFLLLDEATEGLAPVIRAEIWRCLTALKREGMAILVVDKNLDALRELADWHYVVEKGRTVWSGASDALQRDEKQVYRYVGV